MLRQRKVAERKRKKVYSGFLQQQTKSKEVAVLKEKALSLCQNLFTTVLDYKGESMEKYFGKTVVQSTSAFLAIIFGFIFMLLKIPFKI